MSKRIVKLSLRCTVISPLPLPLPQHCVMCYRYLLFVSTRPYCDESHAKGSRAAPVGDTGPGKRTNGGIRLADSLKLPVTGDISINCTVVYRRQREQQNVSTTLHSIVVSRRRGTDCNRYIGIYRARDSFFFVCFHSITLIHLTPIYPAIMSKLTHSRCFLSSIRGAPSFFSPYYTM